MTYSMVRTFFCRTNRTPATPWKVNEMKSRLTKLWLIPWALIAAIPIFGWVARLTAIPVATIWTLRHGVVAGLAVGVATVRVSLSPSVAGSFLAGASQGPFESESSETLGSRKPHRAGDGRRRRSVGISGAHGSRWCSLASLIVICGWLSPAIALDASHADRTTFELNTAMHP
jgi:hypothetical protein